MNANDRSIWNLLSWNTSRLYDRGNCRARAPIYRGQLIFFVE